MAASNVGVLGLGLYLPSEVRTNDFWPASTVENWRERLAKFVPAGVDEGETLTEGVRLSLNALERLRSDPFQGAVERRIASNTELSSDMEAKAVELALSHANVSKDEIDLLLTQSMLPDYMCMNPATVVHHKSGLRRDIRAFTIDSVCASFAPQLLIAKNFIRGGESSRALLTQSCAASRIMPLDQPWSAWLGDAATAAVVGPVESDLGLLSMVFRNEGSLHGAFVATVPDKRWYEDGRVVAWNADRKAARKMQLTIADMGREVLSEAFEKAKITANDVDFFVCHQPSVWLRGVVQELCGMNRAKSVDIFRWAGSTSSALPLMQLAVGQREGLLKKGDTVAMFTVASGMMAVGAVMRWAI